MKGSSSRSSCERERCSAQSCVHPGTQARQARSLASSSSSSPAQALQIPVRRHERGEVLDLLAWVEALPDGLDTRLSGSHGLSAGEGQLLAFARAFLADPAVVVLDEASSRLDPATERRITRATERLLAGRTAVVIAHRLDTLARVDEIAVLERGRVVEHGRRAALAADPSSRYARLRSTARAADTADADRDPSVDDDLLDRPEEVPA